jgi:hypothetical protein
LDRNPGPCCDELIRSESNRHIQLCTLIFQLVVDTPHIRRIVDGQALSNSIEDKTTVVTEAVVYAEMRVRAGSTPTYRDGVIHAWTCCLWVNALRINGNNVILSV